MRILRLELLRYGPFTDRVVRFRPDAKVHLVYGPNEAGKSSSLAAIGDLLFGFSKRKEYDFVHEAGSLRVAAEIASRGGGETLTFRRKRGSRNTLLSNDDSETLLQEDTLVPFLGNLGREVFERAFGLNSDTLRQGGEAMLESEGEMGVALFAAASGLTRLAHIRRELESEATAIFVPRVSKERSFYQVLDRYEAAITTERRNELKSSDYRALIAEIEDVERELASVKSRRIEATAALSRLARLKLVEPILSAIDLTEAELASFADLPEVPEGFIVDCRVALDASEGATLQERTAEEDVAIARASLEAIEVDHAFIDRAERIVELFSQKGDYLSKIADVPRIEVERDEFTLALVDFAQRLGFSEADDLVKRAPPEAVINTARTVIDQGLALETSIAADEKHLAEEYAVLEAQDSAGVSGSLVDPKPWREQYAGLAPDLKELDEQPYLETTHRNLLQKLKDGGMRLVPQVVDVELLARITLPTREMVAVYKGSFERLLSDRRAETVQMETNVRHHAEAMQRLAETEQSGPVAYQETLQLVRADRDKSFLQLRAQLLREGRMLDPGLLTSRVARYEQEIAEADALADQAIADARRLSSIAALNERIAELELERPEIQARLDRLAEEQVRTIDIYNQLFAAAGITPIGPDAMEGWLGAVEDLLVTRKEAELVAMQIDNLGRLAEQVQGSLLALAHNLGLKNFESMPAVVLSRMIGNTLEEMQARWNGRLTLEGARQAGLVRISQLEDSLSKARKQRKEWQGRFDQVLPMLGLDRNTTIAAAQAALNVWLLVPDIIKERSHRMSRLAAIRRDTVGFAEAVQKLAKDLTPMLTELPPQGLIDVMRERAESARAAKARQDDARVRLEIAEAKLATARGAREASSGALTRLATLLPEGADQREELERLARRESLRLQLAERRKEFDRRSEGVSEDVVRDEMQGFDRDRAPFDAEDLERQGEALHAENNRLYALLGQKQTQREALEGGVGSEFAALQRTMAETDIVALARQWAVRKIASTMLNAAIEKHREAQSDPLVTRAGELFRTLTGGSFGGVVQDYGDDDQPRLVGVRRTGERVAIAGMSEGTRDQLYLALRLAYLEDYARRTEPVPFVGDDIFQTFDDERTHAGIRAFASTSGLFQPILFTHHLSVVAIARRALGDDLDYVELSPEEAA